MEGPIPPDDLPQNMGFIEACLGVSPGTTGLDSLIWVSRVEFMIRTYEMFALLLRPDVEFTFPEIIEFRRLTLLWGQAFSRCSFRPGSWTSYFHRLHEHVFWELLRFLSSLLFLYLCVYFYFIVLMIKC